MTMASMFVMFMRFGNKVWDLERHCVTFQCGFVRVLQGLVVSSELCKIY